MKKKLFVLSVYFAFMILFYHLFRLVYFGSIRIAARWNTKAKLWIEGRKNWQKQLKENWIIQPHEKVVWMHCASLGEFEQGRPLLEKIKSQYPSTKILLTFFSPSGFEIQKKYSGADLIMYLPEDSSDNATEFIALVQPTLAIFIKYEFWYNYLTELKNKKVETILVSGVFRNNQPFFQWWGGFYRSMLQNFSHLFIQNKSSAQLLAQINMQNNVTVCGDTRFDRVLELVEKWQPVPLIENFIQPGKKILVAGSTWKDDEELIAQWFQNHQNDWQLIIAPHEIDEEHIEQLQKLFNKAQLFSSFSNDKLKHITFECIIINSIGLLSRLYKYATVCYVGGGFTKDGVHNTLEAVVYNKPVITGPNISKYREAVELKENGCLFTIQNEEEMNGILNSLNITDTGEKAKKYVQQNAGATSVILHYIQEKRLFTNA
jgi:3-deoxy-D-manno-octulosonic-acid transferase